MSYITGDATTLKELNKAAIFELVRSHQHVSQPELSKLTGLTPATILSILDELKDAQLIIEREPGFRPDGIVRAGRPPRYFSINSDGGAVLGISVDKEFCNFSVINFAAQEELRDQLRLPKDTKPMTALTAISHKINELKSAYPLSHIGLVVPGIIDQQTQIVIHGETFLVGLPICQYIEEQCGIPVSLIHNTLALTKYEYVYGESRDTHNLLYILVDEGIGAGMILNGTLYSGAQGVAGEIGNNVINLSGKKKLLNEVSSNKAIRQKTFEKMRGQKHAVSSPEELSIEQIKERYQLGDEPIIKIVNEAAGYLGKFLVNMALTLNPEVIVIGGRITETPGFINTLTNSIHSDPSSASKAVTKHLRIRQSKSIERTSAIAAGVHALAQLGVSPNLMS